MAYGQDGTEHVMGLGGAMAGGVDQDNPQLDFLKRASKDALKTSGLSCEDNDLQDYRIQI